jgi:hypothetical protein
MHAISLQQIFAIIPSTVTRYLKFGLQLLLLSLCTIPDARIQWLEGPEFECCSALIVVHHGRLGGAFGDGLKLPAQTSDDVDIKNATFNGWLSEHFISSVLVFSAEGEFDPEFALCSLTICCRGGYCCKDKCPW